MKIGGSDGGYGPARSFAPDETKEIDAALRAIADDQFWSRFDAEEMTSQGIYPEVWDEPEADLKEEYTMYFREMKRLIAAAASQGHGLLVVLT